MNLRHLLRRIFMKPYEISFTISGPWNYYGVQDSRSPPVGAVTPVLNNHKGVPSGGDGHHVQTIWMWRWERIKTSSMITSDEASMTLSHWPVVQYKNDDLIFDEHLGRDDHTTNHDFTDDSDWKTGSGWNLNGGEDHDETK